jgi:hypothetical protein
MATGDAALEAGFDLVLPTDDVRNAWNEINKSRDYAAGSHNERGLFAGATTGGGDPIPGLVTIDHTLGTIPGAIFTQDRNVGGAATTRKISVANVTPTQVQFVVYNGGAVLSGNPVEFYWQVYA